MTSYYKELEAQLTTYYHLEHLSNIAHWDEAVVMPVGAAESRADALGTLHALQHEHLTSNKTQDLLEQAKEDRNLSTHQQTNLDHIEKKIIHARAVPTRLVKALTKASMQSEQQWRQLRAENNWKAFVPYLDTTFQLTREVNEAKSEQLNLDPYTILLDNYNPGFSKTDIDGVFDQLTSVLPSMIEQITERQSTQSITPLSGHYSTGQQISLNTNIMQSLCFNFDHGRIDVSHHPFCGGNPDDTRITTRYDESDFLSSLMGTCHETGHAKYEQNLPVAWRNQPAGQAMGMAVHESQSLFVEMQLCRSEAFFDFLLTKLPTEWLDEEAINSNNLYRIATRVSPSLIRVDADEVTYPLHVILRYEIEKMLFSGGICIQDLPEYWNSFMKKHLGLSTKNDFRNGVMQDVHWPSGAFGYFPAYTLGRLIAAQLHEAMEREITHVPDLIRQGNFKPIFDWLKRHVHCHGQLMNTNELLKSSTGKALSAMPFIEHIKRRYLT